MFQEVGFAKKTRNQCVQPAVLQVNPKDALAMYGVRMQMPDAPMLRRTFHALVAMFQAAHNCDFYITKYHAKPMAQLQSLFTNIALGLRRLEAEEEAAQAGAEQSASLPEERARKTVLKIANAANRSPWCSCCEMASFIKTGALARKNASPQFNLLKPATVSLRAVQKIATEQPRNVARGTYGMR